MIPTYTPPSRASVLARQAADEAQAWSDSTAGRGLEPRVDDQAAAAAREFCRAYADCPANAVGRRSADEVSRGQRLTVATAALLAVATEAGIDPGELAVVCGGGTAAAMHATAEAANAALWA